MTPNPAEIRVLVADSNVIQSQLLSRALRARRNLRVSSVRSEVTALNEACAAVRRMSS